MSDETFPVLYILMRSDLDSMCMGKAMAQASHASNAFLFNVFNDIEEEDPKAKLALDWQESTLQGFGTVLVLEVNEKQMREKTALADRAGYVAEIIHDPTYPLLDGDALHTIPLDTCSYVFGDKNDEILSTILGDLELHP